MAGTQLRVRRVLSLPWCALFSPAPLVAVPLPSLHLSPAALPSASSADRPELASMAPGRSSSSPSIPWCSASISPFLCRAPASQLELAHLVHGRRAEFTLRVAGVSPMARPPCSFFSSVLLTLGSMPHGAPWCSPLCRRSAPWHLPPCVRLHLPVELCAHAQLALSLFAARTNFLCSPRSVELPRRRIACLLSAPPKSPRRALWGRLPPIPPLNFQARQCFSSLLSPSPNITARSCGREFFPVRTRAPLFGPSSFSSSLPHSTVCRRRSVAQQADCMSCVARPRSSSSRRSLSHCVRQHRRFPYPELALTCSTTPRQLALDTISSSFRASSKNSKRRVKTKLAARYSPSAR
jgi:hypothetical protein